MRNAARAWSSRDRLQVLAWPAFRKQEANPQAALLARELVALDVDVSDWTPSRALARPRDLWHLHYPETVVYRRSAAASTFEMVAFLALLWLARLRGVRIVWTVHDLGSNDGLHPRLERWFWKGFVPACDALVCLSECGRTMVLDRFPTLVDRPAHMISHGGYHGAYASTVPPAHARAHLGISPEAKVLLHFGLLRPYKNVPHLIRTFRAMPDGDAVLLIAGAPFDVVVEREIRAAAAGAANVRLDLRRIPADEVQQFFAAADLVVLPYRRILNSGAVMLAITLDRPVLVPDLGSMREQQDTFGAEWIRLYAGDLTVAELTAASEWARTTHRRPIEPDSLDWRPRARQIKAVYQELIKPRRPRPWLGRARTDEGAH